MWLGHMYVFWLWMGFFFKWKLLKSKVISVVDFSSIKHFIFFKLFETIWMMFIWKIEMEDVYAYHVAMVWNSSKTQF